MVIVRIERSLMLRVRVRSIVGAVTVLVVVTASTVTVAFGIRTGL